MNYSEAINRLLGINLFGGMKLSLANSLKLNESLGFPAQAFPSIHIAGTNGKGSVTKKIAAALQHAGHRVGLYTSPHISCFRERIRINGEMIPEPSVAVLLSRIFDIIDAKGIDATFFEIATLLAFSYFAQEKIDVAVIETGLGGRFDATNIVSTRLSVITSISLDHTEVLGKTVEAIAHEKAGIIKPNVPVVLGPRLPHHIFQDIAQPLNCPYTIVTGQYSNFEEENCAVAHAALKELAIDENSIVEGLKARLPCRMETIIKNGFAPVILDVAHNPDGLHQLIKSVKREYPTRHLCFVCGFSKNKDIAACVKIIQENASNIHLVEAPNGRGAPVNQLKALLVEYGYLESRIFTGATISESIHEATSRALELNEIVIVCGTFFIMRDARAALGIIEPRDAVDMNERNPLNHSNSVIVKKI